MVILKKINAENASHERVSLERDMRDFLSSKIDEAIEKRGGIKGQARSRLCRILKDKLDELNQSKYYDFFKKILFELIKERGYKEKDYNYDIQTGHSPISPTTMKYINEINQEKEELADDIAEINSTISDFGQGLSSSDYAKRLFKLLNSFHSRAIKVLEISEQSKDFNALIKLDKMIVSLLTEILKYEAPVYDEVYPKLKSFIQCIAIYRENVGMILESAGMEGVADEFNKSLEGGN